MERGYAPLISDVSDEEIFRLAGQKSPPAATPEELEEAFLLPRATAVGALDFLEERAEDFLTPKEVKSGRKLIDGYYRTLNGTERLARLCLQQGDWATDALLVRHSEHPEIIWWLNRALLKAGCTQEELAGTVQVHPSTLSRTFRNINVADDTVMAIAEALALKRHKNKGPEFVTDVDTARSLLVKYRCGDEELEESPEEWDLPAPADSLDKLVPPVGTVGATIRVRLGKLSAHTRRLSSADKKGADKAIDEHRTLRTAYYRLARVALGVRQGDENTIREALDAKYGLHPFLRDLELWRRNVRLTQDELAEALEWSPSKVSRTFSGRLSMEPDAAEKIVRHVARRLPKDQRQVFMANQMSALEKYLQDNATKSRFK